MHGQVGLTHRCTGNTFPAVVFTIFGGFWLTLGGTLVPGYGAYATYSTTGNAADGLAQPQFFATFAFFLVAMAVLCFVLAVASLRTNVVLLGILTLLAPTCEWMIGQCEGDC